MTSPQRPPENPNGIHTSNGHYANGQPSGKYEAPHFLNGASSASANPSRANPSRKPTAPSPQRTVFLPEPNHADLRRPAYILDQFLFFGAPLRRFVVFILVTVALVAATGVVPGGWIVSLLCVGLLVAFIWYLRNNRRRDFVEFNAQPAPDPIPERLSPNDKIPVYVTGLFSVEGKFKRFAQLPGFYRTFATGEHALLCLIRDRRILSAGHWPEEDIGMWYMFFTPDLIQTVQWGTLAFGPDRGPAIAVTYQLTIPPGDQNPRERIVEETIYMMAESPDAAQRILADLVWELPPTAQPVRDDVPASQAKAHAHIQS